MEIVEFILKKLSLSLGADKGKLDSLPVRAFIAGGAIGNILLSQKHTLILPINDIDIFVEKIPVPIFNTDGTQVEQDEYIDPSTPETVNRIQIQRVTHDKLINTIEVDTLTCSDTDFANAVLDSFDFNCVKVGLLKREDGTWELISTSEFDQCLKDKQVRLSKVKYPFRTFVRFFKKKQELNGLYFNTSDIKLLFNMISHSERTQIAESTFKKYNKFVAKQFRNGFQFSTGNIRNGKTYLSVTPNRAHPYHIGISEKVKSQLTTLEKSKTYFSLFLNSSKPQKERLSFISGYKNVLGCLLKNKVIVPSTSPSRDVLKSSNLVLGKYPNLLSNKKADFISGLKTIAKFNSFFKNHPIFHCQETLRVGFVGYVEKQIDRELDISELSDLGDKFLSDDKNCNLFTELAKPIPLKISGVRELICQNQLLVEGHEMNHCVGGYYDKINDGLSRIFSIESPKGRSTLEVGTDKGIDKAYIIQHRSAYSRYPDPENHKIAVDIIKALRNLVRK